MEHETGRMVLALLCIGLVLAFPTQPQIPSRVHTANQVQYCGAKLATEISIVCKGRYNTLIPRTTTTSMPFINPQDAKSMMRRHRRRRRGVTDECCKKPCTYDELRTFCAPP